jgi:hypothetical protein
MPVAMVLPIIPTLTEAPGTKLPLFKIWPGLMLDCPNQCAYFQRALHFKMPERQSTITLAINGVRNERPATEGSEFNCIVGRSRFAENSSNVQ